MQPRVPANESQRLDDLQRLHERLIACSRDCIKILDLEGRLLFVNEGGEGVTTDGEGNVYLAAGHILVYDPSGKLIETISQISHALGGKSAPVIDGMSGEERFLAPGALADIVAVEGDPLKDMSLFQNYRENITMIMQDGKVYKNII